MELEIRVPEVGESVQEAILAEWFKADGDAVAKDEALFLLETDKITLEVPAEAAGTLQLLVAQGSTVAIGDVVGRLTVAAGEGEAVATAEPEPAGEAVEEPPAKPAPTPEVVPDEPPAPPKAESPKAAPAGAGPAVRRLLEAHGLDPAAIPATGPGGRLTKGDVLLYLEGNRDAERPVAEVAPPPPAAAPAAPAAAAPVPREVESAEVEGVTRRPMSPIRKRIAERLLEATRSTAMLTTFNEIDMSEVMAVRSRYQDAFLKRYGVKLGFTSFFVKAVVEALEDFPLINASIEGDEIVEHHYHHIGIAVGGERGLVVPVLRHADRMSFAEIEGGVAAAVEKIRTNRLQLSDLAGGTFSITNGGVFGSLLSTPILNYPQSGILGLHKIEDRPVVVDGEIVVRPMMYVALSYDHRMVDGREAVQFLARIKALVEDPERLLVEV